MRDRQSSATVTPPHTMMLQQLRVALLSAVTLLVPSTGAVLKGYKKPAEGVEKHHDGLPGRRLKHTKFYKHHLAIQEAFATQSNVHDDDFTATYQEGDDLQTINVAIVDTGAYLDTADSYYGYHLHEVEYLSPEITPQPFINCYPESFHKNNKVHGKHNHKHQHAKNHHDKHHLHEHHHIKEAKHQTGSKSKSKSAYYTPEAYAVVDASLHVPETTYTIATVEEGDTASKSKSKGKGGYYRQRNLAGHRRGGIARRGHYGQAKKRQSDVEAIVIETNFGTDLIGAEDGEEEYTEVPSEVPSFPTTKKYSQVNHHHHDEEQHLPICPNGPRMTIPTIPPRGPPTPANATAPTVAPPGGDTDGAPGAIPPGTDRILVQSTLSYGLFEDATVREATPEEIAGLMMRTSKWYYDQLKPLFPTLQSGETVFLSQTFDASAAYPIMIDFDANGFFTAGALCLRPFCNFSRRSSSNLLMTLRLPPLFSGSPDNPTPEELFTAMDALSYEGK
jgi:hypothetical protein